jgi:hypothetical protein
VALNRRSQWRLPLLVRSAGFRTGIEQLVDYFNAPRGRYGPQLTVLRIPSRLCEISRRDASSCDSPATIRGVQPTASRASMSGEYESSSWVMPRLDVVAAQWSGVLPS